MKASPEYLMESAEEIERLERKTDPDIIRDQALWAGLQPGMRVADVGCGPGRTSQILHQIVQPGGRLVGIDMSRERLAHAALKYAKPGLEFVYGNVRDDLQALGTFDLVWVRFLLEYHRSCSFDIVCNLSAITKPGGILCLIDLDYNCLSHFEMPDRLAAALKGCMQKLEQNVDFDPHMGIKLYSFLYDLGYEDISVSLQPHHLIYGRLKEVDAYNWNKKVEIVFQRSGYPFEEYPGGYAEFFEEFQNFFTHPRRFTYTPVIACRGRKPL
jgi:SAM-dependent methyltransferase